MNIVRTVADVRHALRPRDVRAPIGFVPTMGALHAGHASLLRQARAESRTVVASIFVNPKQFNDPSDLARYPRTEEADAQVAAEAGVDVLFVPPVSEIFPVDFSTSLSMAGPALGFEGDASPRPLRRRRPGLSEALQHRGSRLRRTSVRRMRSRSP